MLNLSRHVSNFYFHIPFCIKKCHFCAFPIHALGQNTSQPQKQTMYDQYCRMINLQIATVLSNSSPLCETIESLYLGGGTPSLLSALQIKEILSNFRSGINSGTQITLEMNPQQIGKAQEFLNVGINRVSIGVQSLNKSTLSQLNRGYDSPDSVSQSQFQQHLKFLSKKASLNLDFIVDLNNGKGQTHRLMEFISDIKPSHLSLYMLEINEGSYLHRNPSKFIPKIGATDHFSQLSHFLTDVLGYEHYEVSNFCLPTFRSKHNSAYWMGNKPFGAFGMGATSLLNNCRISRPKNLSKYYSYVGSLDKTLKADPQFLQIHSEEEKKQQAKWVILSRLRRKEGFTWHELQQCLQMEGFHENIGKLKQQLRKIQMEMSGIVDIGWLQAGARLKVPHGYLFADEVSYRIISCLQM